MEYKYGMSLAGCYIVWNPASKLPPQKLFGSKKEALDVAKIMAKKNQGGLFVVCKLEASAVVGEAVVKEFEDQKEQPIVRFDPMGPMGSRIGSRL